MAFCAVPLRSFAMCKPPEPVGREMDGKAHAALSRRDRLNRENEKA
jgi:hypothetical protein